MKRSFFLLGALAVGFSGCLAEAPQASTDDITTDKSNYYFVGMD